LKQDARQAAFGILLLLIPILLFVYNDYLFFGFTSTLYYIVVVRVVFTLVSIATVVLLHRIKSPETYDRIILSWAIMGTLVLFLIQATRPAGFVPSFFADIIIIVTFYIVIPSRLYFRVGAGLIVTIGEIIVMNTLRAPFATTIAISTYVTYLFANLIGIFISVHLYRQRRGEFKILEEEIGLRAEVARLAELDELTGLYNRRKFLELAEKEAEKCKRYQRPFSFMMLDLDHFKTVNDTYGHQAGDTVLRSFADVVKNQIRNVDVMGRLGGEEFGIVLVETHLDAARVVAERIRQAVAGAHLHFTEKDSVAITVSIGLTEAANSDCVVDHIISKADTALYKVKEAGRDHVEIYN
jgi:diguanylate cyclase (GGDEF)-like protein